jgi:hypothetical protein
MKSKASWIGLVVACGLGASSAAAAAQPAAPPAGYTIDEKHTKTSPDGTTTIEQYFNKETDDWKWQFWVRRQGALTRLDPEPADYPADFIFIDDLKWIVRVQKIGSGTSTLHLYGLTPQGYSRASRRPLGDRAWDYLKTRPDWRKLAKAPEYHTSAYALTRRKDNDPGPGAEWPANRYLVIGLWGDAEVKGRKPMQTTVVHDWRCRYDLQTGKFDVPAVFASNNAKAIVPE